jgi:hypothetical protein
MYILYGFICTWETKQHLHSIYRFLEFLILLVDLGEDPFIQNNYADLAVGVC